MQSLGLLKSFLSYTSQLFGTSILHFYKYILRFLEFPPLVLSSPPEGGLYSLTSVTSLNSEIPPVGSGTTSGRGSEIHICRTGITWGKTTRSFRYDLNQIPYDYTVEVRNRFKGLDLIDSVPDELWNEVRDIVQETGIKTILKRKECKKQNGYLRRPYK